MVEIDKREKFGIFCDELTRYINQNHSEVEFYGYGSYFEKPNKKNPGDLDGGIIMPTLITDKKTILGISKKINELTQELEFKKRDLQINLLDSITCQDGRFLSYPADYTSHIKSYGKNLTGNWDPEKMSDQDYRLGMLSTTGFNFRGIRNDFLRAHSHIDFGSGERKIVKAIELLKMVPRKMKSLHIFRETGDYQILAKMFHEEDKGDSLNFLPEIVGEDIDLTIFGKLEELVQTVDFAKEPEEGINYWAQILTTYESIIEGYIKSHPPKKINVTTTI